MPTIIRPIRGSLVAAVCCCCCLTSTSLLFAQQSALQELRVGLIGLDTSHSVAFTKLLNAESPSQELRGCRVVAAYPYGSRDIESSTSRIPGYTEQVRKLGVEIVDSVGQVIAASDVVLLETNDGRPHLEQVLPVLKAGKPVFVDKPIAASLEDAIAIFEASQKFGAPVFSSSSLRYMDDAQAVRGGSIGAVTGCDAYSPCSLEPTHPDLYWYGIHGVEILFTVMGPECETVSRTSTQGSDVAVGIWSGGRIGTFRGMRTGKSGYGGTAFGEKKIQVLTGYHGYEPLLVKVVEFFRTRQPPVDPAETLAIYAFMEAADESKRRGGEPVSIADVMARARIAADARLKAMLADAP